MTYCTIDQARDAGAVGDDTEVASAVAEAGRRIDAYTGGIWSQRTLALVARVEADGTVMLPFVVQSVTAVTPVGMGSPTPLPSSSYLVLSSTTLGQVDALVLGGQYAADPLIVGAEPWRGGFANLLRSTLTGQVTVAGVFGPAVTPSTIVDACAALAAYITTGGSVVRSPTSLNATDEGDAVAVTLNVEQATTRASTTGLPSVDAVLGPLVRTPIRVG